MSSIFHSGCVGDITAALPIARSLGGADWFIYDRPWTKVITSPERFNYIAPLARSQPYVKSFEICDNPGADYDLSTFRSGGLEFGKSLADIQADWAGVKISHDPWISVDPDKKYEGAIVITRTERYPNIFFPWEKLISFYKKDCIFLGLPHEHHRFQNEIGVSIPFVKTESLLDVARILAASRLHIGNQSSPINVSVALGIRFVMEVSLTAPDVIYNRPQSHYCCDGGIYGLKVEGYEEFNNAPAAIHGEVDWLVSPPGGYWKYISKDGQKFSDFSATQLLRQVNRHEQQMGIPLSSKQDIANYMIGLHPSMERGGYATDIKRRITAVKGFIAERQK